MISFSIVTPVLNRRDLLAQALESVTAQDWPALEHIVADGGSKDGAPELAAERGARVLPGPDGGIYHGLNRALSVARHDIIGWLNSDDVYEPGALAAAAAAFARDPSLEAVCGGALIAENDGNGRVYSGESVADLSPGALLIGPALPNAWFFRRHVIEALGPFNTALRYSADGDFLMRFARRRPAIAALEGIVYRYRRHEGSATIGTGAAPEALRRDMLELALMWRADADPAARAAARALEGRCRAALAASALRRGAMGEAAAALRHGPVLARGIFDYAARRLHPKSRARRLGALRKIGG